MRTILQHHLNSLHVMVRFTRLGVSQPRARAWARRWEALAHPWLYQA